MLDILTAVHSFADPQTASRIRQTCRKLGALAPEPILYSYPKPYLKYEYRVGPKLHRLDGPTTEYTGGSKCWYRGGIARREYHPYFIGSMFCNEYKVEDLYHREAGPSVTSLYEELWYFRGLLHRKAGPARKNGGETWYTLGKLHRLDGPAYINV